MSGSFCCPGKHVLQTIPHNCYCPCEKPVIKQKLFKLLSFSYNKYEEHKPLTVHYLFNILLFPCKGLMGTANEYTINSIYDVF